MDNEKLLQQILNKLEDLEKGQNEFKSEMYSFKEETNQNFKELNKKLDLLTK